MDIHKITPIAAFDIEGTSITPLEQSWPDVQVTSGYRWLHLDLNDPNTAAWARAQLPTVAADALLQSETRPRCDRLEDGLIVNLRGVNLNPDASPEDMVSLRMWITPQAVVSARMRKVWAVDAIRERAEGGHAPDTIGAFVVEVAQGLTNRIETVSLDLEAQTDALEDAALDGGKPAAQSLTSLRQAVIKMRRFITPQRDAVTELAQIDNEMINRPERVQLREMANRTKRIVEELDATRDRLQALQDQLHADQAQALSRHSYVLSVVAAIFLPLGFLTGLFGVNVAGMPGVEHPLAFWWLAGLSLGLGLILYLVFKLSRWL